MVPIAQKDAEAADQRHPFSAAVAGLAAAAVPLGLLRGFTVDDAWIVARYAAHVAAGLGYRFNAHGAPTDGVTPLGLPLLLAPFGHGGTMAAFHAARLLGAGAWLCASAMLGIAVCRSSQHPARWAALAIVATSAPAGAWSVSGLETGLALAWSTVAVCLPLAARFALPGAAAAGLVAWLRPEALPLACVLGVGRARSARSRRDAGLALAASVLPFAIAATVRLGWWGHPYPLALLAKPSDLHHGLVYVAAAGLLGSGCMLIAAAYDWRRLERWPRTLLLALLAHAGAVAAAGGDWMPLSRLFVPVLPALVLLAAHELSLRPGWPRGALALLAVALAGQGFAWIRVGRPASVALPERLALMAEASPVLARFRTIASVDIGWVGAVTEAEVVDLAGVTDVEIAVLAGGHTSKRITGAMLEARGVDAILVWRSEPDAWSHGGGTPTTRLPTFAELRSVVSRGAEHYLLADPIVARDYEVAWVSSGDRPIRYALLARRGAQGGETHQDSDGAPQDLLTDPGL